jgi:hypothetical protein
MKDKKRFRGKEAGKKVFTGIITKSTKTLKERLL